METEQAELLNLAWKDYQQSTVKTFQNLLGDEIFADVTLACGKGQQLKAHKVILSSCSPFFRNILVANPHQHPILYLTGVDMEDLESLMRFMYQGEVQIENEGLSKFLETANDLEVDGLFQRQEKEKARQKQKQEELERENAALREKEMAILREKEMAILREREKEAVREKEKAVQRKKVEQWELDKKVKKRKAPSEAFRSPEPEIKKEPIVIQHSAAKSSKLAASPSPKSEKKQPISWLQFLESQAAEKKIKQEEASPSQVQQTPKIAGYVDVDANIDAVHEITAIDDDDIGINDALEVEFPEDIEGDQQTDGLSFGFALSTASGRHECEFCPKSFARRNDAERHVKKYHTVGGEGVENGTDKDPIDFGNLNATVCDVCQKVFTTKWSMQEHRDSVHEGIRFLCDHCDHIASSKRNLRGHMGKKHPDMPLPARYTSIKADDTGYQRSFQTFQGFKNEDSSSAEVEPLALGFDESGDMGVEEEGAMVPTDEDGVPQMFDFEPSSEIDHELEDKLEAMAVQMDGAWTCLECGKTAGTKFHLKRHAEIHLTGYSHTCPSCFKSFNTRPSLKQHFDSHHRDEKKGGGYPCDECEKSAISKGALRIHKYRHHSVPTTGTVA